MVSSPAVFGAAVRPARVLLVTTDPALIALVRVGFQADNIDCTLARARIPLAEQVRRHRPDLLILDSRVPALAIPHICRQVRVMTNGGVVLLTADSRSVEPPPPTEVAPDHVLPIPDTYAALRDRVPALLTARQIDLRRYCQAGPLVLDRVSYRVTHAGQPVALTLLEFQLLDLLLSHPGQTFSRPTLLDRLWGPGYVGTPNVVDVHLGHVRRKLGTYGPTLIATFPGRRYGVVVSDDRA